MALFFYQAFSKDGKKVSGHIDAPTEQGVKDQLSKQGLFPISISAGTLESQQPWWRRLLVRSIPLKEKVLFTRQLATLLRSGVPLLQALELLVDHFEGSLRTTIVAIKDDIKEGRSLAEALKKFPKTFDTIYVQLVRAGEATGNLEIILDRLTDFMERREAIRKKINAALRGPIIQMVVAALVVGVILTQVVPTMAENFSQFGESLPLPTRILVALSDFLVAYYLFIIIAIILIILGLRYWAKTPSGGRIIDSLLLKIPIVSYFSRMNAVVQFSYTLGLLEQARVNLAESLDIVVSIIDNRILADALKEARDKIIKQGKITQYLKQTNIFPSIATYLIKTGEESGNLGEMLLTVARNYEEELGDYSDSLSAKIAPILLIGMAVVVGFIVLSIALPMLKMNELVSAGI